MNLYIIKSTIYYNYTKYYIKNNTNYSTFQKIKIIIYINMIIISLAASPPSSTLYLVISKNRKKCIRRTR